MQHSKDDPGFLFAPGGPTPGKTRQIARGEWLAKIGNCGKLGRFQFLKLV